MLKANKFVLYELNIIMQMRCLLEWFLFAVPTKTKIFPVIWIILIWFYVQTSSWINYGKHPWIHKLYYAFCFMPNFPMKLSCWFSPKLANTPNLLITKKTFWHNNDCKFAAKDVDANIFKLRSNSQEKVFP